MENTNYNKDQVFISFRGKDQRHTFLSHLKQKLIDSKVNVLTDENLIGQPLKNIFGHIRNSTIAIVIFSESYPESDWCWDELVEIQKCRETEKLKAVIPIFHNVKVSTVKEQSEDFGDKFSGLQKDLLSKNGIEVNGSKEIDRRVESWKKALIAVTQTCGLSYKKDSSEAAFAKQVVDKVKQYLPKTVAAETSKSSERKQQNLIVFNNSRFEVNNYHFPHSSLEALEGLSLVKCKSEDYNMIFNFMKPMSRRTNSDPENLVGPFPIERLIAQKRIENQRSIDNADNAHQQNYKAGERHKSTPATNESVELVKPLSGDFRGTNSDLDHRNQYGPYPSTMVQKQPENQRNIDNIPQKKYRSGTCCVSSIRYCFGRCLCLNESEQKMIQTNPGNEPSFARI